MCQCPRPHDIKNEITDVPQGFKDWVAENEKKQAGWKSAPYFVKDNFVNGQMDEGLKFAAPVKTVKPVKPVKTDAQKADIQKRWDERKELLRKQAIIDVPHKAMKTSYPDADSVKDTIKQINDEFTGDKWFEHGVGKLVVETRPNYNGSTQRSIGMIWLTKDRMDLVRSAMEKIGNKKSYDITEEEAKAMATYWHEITHNRNKGTDSAGGDKSDSRKNMELANEFVARKTLPEFYSKLGAGKMPHSGLMINRKDTGYNDRVKNYDFIINKLGLDSTKVLNFVQTYLYNGLYAKQVIGLREGLVVGGIKKIDGTKVKTKELNELIEKCREGVPEAVIENWLKQNGFLK